jgi:hypothetical protein
MVVRSERGLFSLLGVTALAGRTFRDDDPATVAVVARPSGRSGSAATRRSSADRSRSTMRR